jgi:hypothetical protein
MEVLGFLCIRVLISSTTYSFIVEGLPVRFCLVPFPVFK